MSEPVTQGNKWRLYHNWSVPSIEHGADKGFFESWARSELRDNLSLTHESLSRSGRRVSRSIVHEPLSDAFLAI